MAAKKTAKKPAKRAPKARVASSDCKTVSVKGKRRRLCWGQTGKVHTIDTYGIVSNTSARG